MILDSSLTAKEMRAVEMNAEYLGVPRLLLMENAGGAVARAIADTVDVKRRIVIVCGTGGNGGDGFVAARHLAGAGYSVEVFLLGWPSNISSKEAMFNWGILRNMDEGVDVHEIHDSSEVKALKGDLIVDAIAGTGIRGALTSPLKEMVQAINASEGLKIAVDVPTGFMADTGTVHGIAIKADKTLTFHKPKTGLKKAIEQTGQLEVCPIGIPPEAETYVGPGDVYLAQRQRASEAHKGDFGRLLVIGGSETYSGAPALTGMGAYATGVDLVYVAAPETAASIVAGFSTSLITVKLKGPRLTRKNVDAVLPFLGNVDAVALGPGLGVHGETVEAVDRILEEVEGASLPVLLDADALKAFAGRRRKVGEAVFTPHRGEFEILTGKEAGVGHREQGGSVMKEAKKLGATILLKGAVDVVSDGERVRYNWTGNPGMTVGGTGDVLAGVVSAYLAMGAPPLQAAVAGAFVNGAAGDYACEEMGYNFEAHDLLGKIPLVIEDALKGRMRRSATSQDSHVGLKGVTRA
ncbi:MAG: NAD(P)H-hydrate dehydratase [Candidatus Bathyarchaeota archaeon]|nr:MAG: NAD(P)H-hydrate dehydratase [Candidatus Bathyarchaeota archaeon]